MAKSRQQVRLHCFTSGESARSGLANRVVETVPLPACPTARHVSRVGTASSPLSLGGQSMVIDQQKAGQEGQVE